MFSNKNEFNQNFVQNLNMDNNLEKNMQEWCVWDTQIWLCSSSLEKINAISNNSDKFACINHEFCSWELTKEGGNSTKYSSNLCSSYEADYLTASFNMNPTIDPVKSRKRNAGLPDIDENLLKVLNLQF